MILMFQNGFWTEYRPRWKKCNNFCAMLGLTVCFLTLLTLISIFSLDVNRKVYIVYIAGFKPEFVTDEKFLSIALDTSIIASSFKHFNLKDSKIHKMMSALSPAYLRIGGTMADRLTFSPSGNLYFKHLSNHWDGGQCANEAKHCDYLDKPNFTMNADEWLELNHLARSTGLDLIFDLNALKRFDNGSWDYRNAEALIHFSDRYGLSVKWELGNEPNAFRHQFDYEVAPSQMARDFHTLYGILNKYPNSAKTFLIGPDVTRPQPNNNGSQTYLKEFLPVAGDVLNAITWHQYYFNGATAKALDFLNPDNFDILKSQIDIVKDIVKSTNVDKPIWLGETSSAYGGGAPHLSNRYIASFLWLDKLGMAAKNSLSVVIRQSIFQGYYALINDHYFPTPDWWVSVLYKKLVGNKVVSCNFPNSEKVRLYCHCTQTERRFGDTPSVTVFGINLHYHKAKIRFEGITPSRDRKKMQNFKVQSYVLTTMQRIDSRFIYLNDDLLLLTETNDVPKLLPKTVLANPYVEMPAYSLAFWVVPVSNNAVPYC